MPFRSGNTWRYLATISQNNEESCEGYSVRLSPDTAILAAGAPCFNGTGATQLYTRSGNSWKYQTTLSQGNASREGYSLSLAANNNLLAAGAPAFNSSQGVTFIYDN